jgi:hypothetical protein
MAHVEYVVKDDVTLGYIFKEQPGVMGVLSGNKDGHNWKNGPVSTFGSKIRFATEADFETFRVQVPPDFQGVPDDLPEIDASLPASHEEHLAEFHADRAAGYSGSIYEWHKAKYGTFW